MRCNLLYCALAVVSLSATAGGVVILPDAKQAKPDAVSGQITIEIHEFKVDPNDQWQLSLPLPSGSQGNVNVEFAGHLPKIHSEGLALWLSYMDDQGHTIMTSPQMVLPTYFNFMEFVPPMATDVVLHAENPWTKQVVVNQAQVTVIPVPDPATFGLLAIGAIALVARYRR